MAEKVMSAGDEINSYCSTCKTVLAHKVATLIAGKVEKVICNNCGKRHKYRPKPPKSMLKKAKTRTEELPAEPKKKRIVTRAKTEKPKKAKEPTLSWEETLAGRDVASAKKYAMSAIFEKDDIIDHDKFGYGLVLEIIADGKMKVRFQEGEKLMVYGRKKINV